MEGSLVAYKVFTNGSVLNASEVNDNLMNQAVITFSNSAARASAITSPVEGMLTYLEDTQTYESWDGAAWVALITPASSGNAIINGAFEINQRNFSSSTSNGAFGFDRWFAGLVDGTATYSSQAFSPGTGPAGYESANFARLVTSGQTLASAVGQITQTIEDVRNFAGQTATVSFFAKAASGTPQMAVEFQQNFGTGGSPSSDVFTLAGKVTLSTSWQRFDLTVAVPSISGKTIGTTANTSGLRLRLFGSAGSDFNARTDSLGIQSNTFDIWGVQVEAGSTATPFRRNGANIGEELASCQRYYYRSIPGNTQGMYGTGLGFATTGAFIVINLPVTMRAIPSSVDFSTLRVTDSVTNTTVTTLNITSGNTTTNNTVCVDANVASGLTQFRPYILQNGNSTAGFIGFSAEL
jgi:hypothetical protein